MGEVHHFLESFFKVFNAKLTELRVTYVGGRLINAGHLVNHLDTCDLPGSYPRETHRFRDNLILHRFHRANEGLLGVTRGNRSTRRDSDLLNRLPERFHEVVVLHEALLDSDKSLIRSLQLGGLPVPDGHFLSRFQFAYGVLEVRFHGGRVTVTEQLVKRRLAPEESNDRVGEEAA